MQIHDVPDTPNMWDQVDDFKWLKAGPSPHWSVLGSHDDRNIDKNGWEIIIGGRKSQTKLELMLSAARIS